MDGNEVAFLQQDADEDVAGGRGREQQMADRHRRRGPKREQKAEIDRVANESIEQGVAETR